VLGSILLDAAIRTLALALVLGFASCAAPLIGPAHDVSERAAALLASAPDVYGPDAARVPTSPEQARFRATFEGALLPAARPSLHHEPALDLVARVVADMAGEGQPPSQALIQWLFWRAGATSRYARVELTIAQGVDDLDLQTVDFAGKAQASVYPESFGIARSSRGKGAQAIVFGRRALEVDPLPKAYAPGAAIAMKVRPTDAFTDLEVAMDDDHGGVTVEKMKANGDGTFAFAGKAPTQPGRYFVEITGLDPRTLAAMPENPWRRSLFWVPVYAGVPEPAAPDAFIRAPAPSPADQTTWPASIVDGYNEARVKAGKRPIAIDGRLTALAHASSEVVARAGREPPPDVVLADKLAASGNPPHDYDTSHARIDSVSDYVKLRLLEPANRRRVTARDALVLGIGLTPYPANAHGDVDDAIVEDLVEPVARLDPAKDRALVVAALDALAAAEGRPAYKHDEDLSKVIQQFAFEVCRGEKRANQMKPLVDKARGVGDKYHQWTTPAWRTGYDYTRWEEQSVLAKAKDAPLAYAEAGLCQGDLPGKPGASYVVVIQYAP
jgi:hypothetical protein